MATQRSDPLKTDQTFQMTQLPTALKDEHQKG